jgi:hypothetical protein
VDETGIPHDDCTGIRSSISIPTPAHSSRFLPIEEFGHKSETFIHRMTHFPRHLGFYPICFNVYTDRLEQTYSPITNPFELSLPTRQDLFTFSTE